MLKCLGDAHTLALLGAATPFVLAELGEGPATNAPESDASHVTPEALSAHLRFARRGAGALRKRVQLLHDSAPSGALSNVRMARATIDAACSVLATAVDSRALDNAQTATEIAGATQLFARAARLSPDLALPWLGIGLALGELSTVQGSLHAELVVAQQAALSHALELCSAEKAMALWVGTAHSTEGAGDLAAQIARITRHGACNVDCGCSAPTGARARQRPEASADDDAARRQLRAQAEAALRRAQVGAPDAPGVWAAFGLLRAAGARDVASALPATRLKSVEARRAALETRAALGDDMEDGVVADVDDSLVAADHGYVALRCTATRLAVAAAFACVFLHTLRRS